ncbi:hypothetical protein MSAN_00233700 [Mycena sanguinolenta]|uniref:Uncharacterized protein n=1 Tax=Mycena sanguinolenta TaxID=230812 RepID=A0A8H6ZMB4_9AGAR|nr:hypothetical protein MSAN_00233700 [Mycena sanguinolenta]
MSLSNPSNFNAVYDLDDCMSLARTRRLVRIIARPKPSFVLDHLIWEYLLSGLSALDLPRENAASGQPQDAPPAFVHIAEKPCAVDLTTPLRVAVTGPHVLFERVSEHEELCLRVVMPVPTTPASIRATVASGSSLIPSARIFFPSSATFHRCTRATSFRIRTLSSTGATRLCGGIRTTPARDAALYWLLHPHRQLYITPPKPKSALVSSTSTIAESPESPASPNKRAAGSPSDITTPPDAEPEDQKDKLPLRAMATGAGTGWGLSPDLGPPTPEGESPPARAKATER